MSVTTSNIEPALVPSKSLHQELATDDCQALEGIWAIFQHLFGSNNNDKIASPRQGKPSLSNTQDDNLTVATMDSHEDLFLEDLEDFSSASSKSSSLEEDIELVYNPSSDEAFHDNNNNQDEYSIRIVASTGGSFDGDEMIVMTPDSASSHKMNGNSEESTEMATSDASMEYTPLVMRRIPHTDSLSGIESQLWVPTPMHECEHHTSSWIQASATL